MAQRGKRVPQNPWHCRREAKHGLEERSKTRFGKGTLLEGRTRAGNTSARVPSSVGCGLQFYEGQAARLPRLARELTIQEEIKPPGDKPIFLTSTQSEIKSLELHGSGKLFSFKAHVGKTTLPTASLFHHADSLRILTPDRWGA